VSILGVSKSVNFKAPKMQNNKNAKPQFVSKIRFRFHKGRTRIIHLLSCVFSPTYVHLKQIKENNSYEQRGEREYNIISSPVYSPRHEIKSCKNKQKAKQKNK